MSRFLFPPSCENLVSLGWEIHSYEFMDSWLYSALKWQKTTFFQKAAGFILEGGRGEGHGSARAGGGAEGEGI